MFGQVFLDNFFFTCFMLNSFYSYVFWQHFSFGLMISNIAVLYTQKNLSLAQIGLITSLSLVCGFVFEIPTSFLADKFSKKNILYFGLLFLFLGFLALVLANNFVLLCLSSCLFASGLAFLSGAEESLLSDISSNLTKDLGKMNLWDELGTVLGLAVSGFFGIYWNLQSVYSIGLVVIFISAISLSGINFNQKDLPQSTAKLDFKLLIRFLPLFVLFLVFAERGETIFQIKINQVVGISFLAASYFLGKIGSIFGSLIAHKFEKVNLLWFVGLQIIGISLLFLNNYFVILALFIFLFAENILRTLFKSKLISSSPKAYKTSILSIFSFGSLLFLSIFKPILGFATDYNFTLGIATLILIRFVFSSIYFLTKNKI